MILEFFSIILKCLAAAIGVSLFLVIVGFTVLVGLVVLGKIRNEIKAQQALNDDRPKRLS